MSKTIVDLKGSWAGPAPQLAWIFGLGETAGRALNIVYTAGRIVNGVIDMPAELAKGPGKKKPKYNNEPNKNPTPTALSLCVDQDMYIGFVLDKSMGVVFADDPFSGGYIGSDADYLSATRVSATTAYFIVRGSSFGPGEYSKPFNINLVANGDFGDGVAYSTPIILDPDSRKPDGQGPPP